MYTISDLLLLTKGNYETFKWFIGSLVESVSGRREWGRKKFSETCSEAKHEVTGLPMVSVSDEALSLLFFENYITKWTQWSSPEGKQKFCINDPAKKNRYLGKYTGTSTGSSHFTGWNKNDYVGTMSSVLRSKKIGQIYYEMSGSAKLLQSEEQVQKV